MLLIDPCKAARNGSVTYVERENGKRGLWNGRISLAISELPRQVFVL